MHERKKQSFPSPSIPWTYVTKWKVKKPFSVPAGERENEGGGINRNIQKEEERETETYRKVCERKRETERQKDKKRN